MIKKANKSALSQYKKVGTESDAAYASPHRLIQMLLNGALEKLATAKGHMERGEISSKGENIGWAISIIEGLRVSVDHSAGGEIASNLDALYDYMLRQLMVANLENNVLVVDEVIKLLRTIKSAWDEIGSKVEHAPALSNPDTPILSTTVR